MTAITLALHPVVDLTSEQFYKLCQAGDSKLEQRPGHFDYVMPPTGWGTGKRNFSLTYSSNWVQQNPELGGGLTRPQLQAPQQGQNSSY